MRQISSRSESQNLQSLYQSDNIHRVFNALKITKKAREEQGKAFSGLFNLEVFNTAIFVKHRPRRWEQPMVRETARRHDQTKIILPIDPSDLTTGARTLLISGTSFQETLSLIIGRGHDAAQHTQDIAILKALRDIPNYDPFFLHEKLAATGLQIDERYTRLPEQILEDTKAFVFQEIKAIVQAAYPAGAADSLVTQMAEKLMSDSSSAQLAPLREAFQLNEAAFAEAIYAWRGFLYYKYMSTQHRDALSEIFKEIIAHHRKQRMEPDQRQMLTKAIGMVIREAESQYMTACAIINRYNAAYRMMIEAGDPTGFWVFLQTARSHFSQQGLSVGIVEHFIRYWSYIRPGAKKVHYNHYSDLVFDMRDSLGV